MDSEKQSEETAKKERKGKNERRSIVETNVEVTIRTNFNGRTTNAVAILVINAPLPPSQAIGYAPSRTQKN